MATHTTDPQLYPDGLVEPRTQAGRVARSAPAGLFNGVLLLGGLYLLISPWLVQSIGQFSLAVSNMITGIALALLATGFARTFDRMHTLAWVTPVIGAWVIASPWLISPGSGLVSSGAGVLPPPSVSAWVSNVIAGAVVAVAGICLTVVAARVPAKRSQRA